MNQFKMNKIIDNKLDPEFIPKLYNKLVLKLNSELHNELYCELYIKFEDFNDWENEFSKLIKEKIGDQNAK